MSNLDRAIKLAVDAHEGQLDKAGLPYILHPLRVMERVRVRVEADFVNGLVPPAALPDLLAAAVLHDVVEDEFGETVGDIVDRVTRRKRDGESYTEFITRCAELPAAVIVKDADLDDNLSRIASLPEHERSIEKRYKKAKAYLATR